MSQMFLLKRTITSAIIKTFTLSALQITSPLTSLEIQQIEQLIKCFF